jgi:hypothetical protein
VIGSFTVMEINMQKELILQLELMSATELSFALYRFIDQFVNDTHMIIRIQNSEMV